MSKKISHHYFSSVQNLRLSISMYVQTFTLFFLSYMVLVIALMFAFYRQSFLTVGLFISAGFKSIIAGRAKLISYNFGNGLLLFEQIFAITFIRNLFIWLLYPLLLFGIAKFKKANTNFIRGAVLEDASRIKLKISTSTNLPLGNKLELPIKEEVKHFFVLGRPGTGKTNTFNQWLEKIKSRKNKAIIFDSKGDFLPKFYTAGDLILNPLDIRCVGWNIFNDVETIMDLTAISNSIIPSAPSNTDPIWYEAPRDILYGVLLYCYLNNKKNNKAIWEFLILDIKEISKLLKDIPGAERAYKQLGDPTSKTASSIMLMLIQYAKIFEFMQHLDGDFSIKNWISSDEGNFLFITNYADIQDTIKPIISLFIETAGRKLLSLPDDNKRRVFFFLDEFGVLQKLDTIVNLLTLSRSKGGAIFLGIQDIGRIDKIYGRELRESIINACGNNLIFAVEDTTTAEFCSKKLGEVEYYEDQQSQSLGDSSDRVNINKVKRKEHLILPSQIQGLKDLTAYLKLANLGITYVEFSYKEFKSNHNAFMMKEQFLLSNVTNSIVNEQNNKDFVRAIKATELETPHEEELYNSKAEKNIFESF